MKWGLDCEGDEEEEEVNVLAVREVWASVKRIGRLVSSDGAEEEELLPKRVARAESHQPSAPIPLTRSKAEVLKMTADNNEPRFSVPAFAVVVVGSRGGGIAGVAGDRCTGSTPPAGDEERMEDEKDGRAGRSASAMPGREVLVPEERWP